MARVGKSYPKHALSQKRARGALAMLLSGCTDERLQNFTAEGLAGSYNVSLATAETMLAAAKIGRGL